jgi:hypothetical protein
MTTNSGSPVLRVGDSRAGMIEDGAATAQQGEVWVSNESAAGKPRG